MVKDKHISDGDASTWEDAVRGVKELSRKRLPKEVSAKKPSARKHKASEKFEVPAGNYFHIKTGDISKADRNTADKFRLGKMPIEADIDLHGFTLDESYSALIKFIKKSYNSGKRVLLVVTGKGLRSDEHNTIRGNIENWLNNDSIRPCILMVHPAQPKHGGKGAIYVLLKRKR